jgi:hypothetical protein
VEGLGENNGTANVGHSDTEGEFAGLDLWHYLTSSDALQQLMFSTVMLHWFCHSSGGKALGGRAAMGPKDWLALNRGIEIDGANVPEHVQLRIYAAATQSFIRELFLAPPSALEDPGSGDSDGPSRRSPCRIMQSIPIRNPSGDSKDVDLDGIPQIPPSPVYNLSVPQVGIHKACPAIESGKASALAALATQEGWVEVLGGSLPGPERSGRAATALREGFIEAAVTSSLHEPSSSIADRIDSRCSAESTAEPARARQPPLAFAVPSGSEAQGPVWASLCCMFIFFSSRGSDSATARRSTASRPLMEENRETLAGSGPVPDLGVSSPVAPPHALVDARRLRVLHVAQDTRTVTFAGANGSDEVDKPVSLVLLLPDGRWQELSLPWLELRFPTLEETHTWITKLKQWSNASTTAI